MSLFGLRSKVRGILKTSREPRGPGTVSEERLSHYHCPLCGRWFSIGDAPKVRAVWTCPWCGRPSQYREGS